MLKSYHRFRGFGPLDIPYGSPLEIHPMKRVTLYGLLAVGSLVASIPGCTRTPSAPAPQATVRELATIEGNVRAFFRLPNGRVLLYTVEDTTFTYDIVARRRTKLGTAIIPEHVSPQGDRLAFSRSSGDQDGASLWTMPIDPMTGTATGPAQLVSLRGGRARFSPDSHMLAFRAWPQPDGTFNVVLVPATGGPGRDVATYPHMVVASWSDDGNWLYVQRYGSGPTPNRHDTYIERVPAAGGPSEVLFPVHRTLKDWFENVIGVSAGGRVALYMRNPDQFYFMTGSGATGEITVPLPPLDDGWGHDFTLDRTRYLTMAQVLDQRVHVLDLVTGQVRTPLPPSVQSISPAWSPDGRRLAVRSGNVSNYAITVMNADGSGQRRYPVSPDLREHQDAGSGMLWSPDGRLVAFKADAWQKLAVLDLNSGRTRIVVTSLGEGIGDFAWRSDGNTIVASRLRERTPPWRFGIFEVQLDGTERLLHDLSAELPWALGAIVISEHVAIASDGHIRIVSMPIENGAVRQVSIPIADSGARIGNSGHSPDGKWIFSEVVAGSPLTDLVIMSTAGDSTRIVHLPFQSAHCGVAMLPDGQHIIGAGRTPGDSTLKIFVVLLNGGAPREFGGIPGHQCRGRLTLSPDGRQVAFTTTEGRYTSTILEVDFGPSLQAIANR